MKLLEIKNNLVKLSYSETESPVLGRFIVIATGEKSYVAQLVNLKSDVSNSYAIAKLLFTFTSDGVVDNYDGSIPNVDSELSFLSSSELLDLLPIETPVTFGNLSQQEDMLALDVSIFERNFTVFVDSDSCKATFVSNCVRQLFQMKEKCIIIDDANLFEDYEKVELSRDFKLPLNSEMIDYIFEYDLKEVDASTKAVIQDIFYEVQQYIKTLDGQFLSIDKFVEVVAEQYKSTQMPELALLKNKLLKYKDSGIFADSIEDVLLLNDIVNKRNCIIFDLKNICESLQKEVILHIHNVLAQLDKYTYLFLPINDDNSDKKLLRQIINHNHVFTTLLVSPTYKYAFDLRQHAQNIMLFTPMSLNHDFAIYNTFISKLNPNECIVEGKLTQGIPFVIDMDDLELPLTKEDVLGERCQFVPIAEDVKIVRLDDYGNKILVEESNADMYKSSQMSKPVDTSYDMEQDLYSDVDNGFTSSVNTIKPVANLLNAVHSFDDSEVEINPVEDIGGDDDLHTFDEITDEIHPYDEGLGFNEDLTEEDLNYIEDNQIIENEEIFDKDYEEMSFEQGDSQVVPVYPVEDNSTVSVGFVQGDGVTHPRYGRGVVEKIIKYGDKTLCSIAFENVGRRLLDPSISELTKLGVEI